MLIHDGSPSGEILRLWREFHTPVVAFAVTLGLAVAGRIFKAELLAAAAVGAGVAAGWFVSGDPSFVTGPAFLPGWLQHHRLALMAAGALVLTLAATRFAPRRGFWPALLLAAFSAGWWLTGAKLTRSAAMDVWLPGLAVAAIVSATGWLILAFPGERLRPVMASCTLAAALHVIGAPSAWSLAALVPGLAAVVPLALPGASALAPLAVSLDLAFVEAGVMLSAGRLPRGGLSAGDIAALCPILSLWLLPHLLPRLRGAGRTAPLIAVLAAGGIGVGIAWLWMRVHGS